MERRGTGGRIWKEKSVVWESHGKTRLICMCTHISLAAMSKTNDSFQNDPLLVSLDLPPPRKRFGWGCLWVLPQFCVCGFWFSYILESLTRCLYLSGQPGISVASVRNFRGSSGPVQAGLRWSTLPPSSGSAVPLGGCASCVEHFSVRSVHLRIWWCRCAFNKAALQQLNHQSSWLKNKKITQICWFWHLSNMISMCRGIGKSVTSESAYNFKSSVIDDILAHTV